MRGHSYLAFPAMSSSFRVNFFLRASEIREAESSSRREVQPRLYLNTGRPQNYPHPRDRNAKRNSHSRPDQTIQAHRQQT